MAAVGPYQWRTLGPDGINKHRLSQRKESLEWARSAAISCFFIDLVYMFYRVRLTPATPIAYFALVAEFSFFLLRLSYYLIFSGAKGDSAPSLELVGDEAPTIDIFIMHCGEGVEVISDTLRAACAQDYPAGRSRVILLDDSCSEEARLHVEFLKKQYPQILYTTRGTRPRTHARAGNMNHGLEFTKELPGGPSEFVAFLDADNIPETCWLRRIFPHILADPKVAACCVGARAYNIPPGDSIGTNKETHLYYGMFLPLLGASEKPVIIGTGFVARRKAVDECGGIPTQSINDDGLLTILLYARGWKLVWAQEYLQWNMVTDTLPAQIKQRARWNAGLMDNGRHAATSKESYWTTQQRINSILPCVIFGPATIIFIPLAMIILPFVWLTGTPVIAHAAPVKTFFFISTLHLVAQFFFSWTLSSFSGARMRGLSVIDKSWVYPYFLPALLTHLFPPKNPKTFHAAANAGQTGKNKPPISTTNLIGHSVNCSALVLLALGFAYTAVNLIRDRGASPLDFLLGPGFPPLLLIGGVYFFDTLAFVRALIVPIVPMERSELLTTDEKTGLVYPTQEAQERYALGDPAPWVVMVPFVVYVLWSLGWVLENA